MRMTREDFLTKYPSWNESRHDIVACMYGDVPVKCWDAEQYNEWCNMEGTLSNINAVEAYMYIQNGEYNIYSTEIGKVCITKEGKVISGEINVWYKGKNNTIYLNNQNDMIGLSIFRIGQDLVGWRNQYGIHSCTKRTKEMDSKMIIGILKQKLEDYGIGVQMFMKQAREIYDKDVFNWILLDTF